MERKEGNPYRGSGKTYGLVTGVGRAGGESWASAGGSSDCWLEVGELHSWVLSRGDALRR